MFKLGNFDERELEKLKKEAEEEDRLLLQTRKIIEFWISIEEPSSTKLLHYIFRYSQEILLFSLMKMTKIMKMMKIMRTHSMKMMRTHFMKPS